MADLRRRPWTDADNRALIDLWPRVGSIVLIALELQRSTSSVQTQASRLGLPRRTDGNDRHRRKWTPEDIEALDRSISVRTRSDGKIPICEIADDVARSIDAVAARLIESLDGEDEFFNRIVVTRNIPALKNTAQKTGTDSRKAGKMRPCMCCSKPFWSEGSFNRLCQSCKSGETESNWDW